MIRLNPAWRACAVVCVVSMGANAQWTDDPAENLGLATRTGDQVQSKVVARSDGGVWVSWFDNSTGGYDTYLQRLDASGTPQFGMDGMLISDRAFSSTQDYDLCVDANGDAYLVFRDVSEGESDVQIFAHRVTESGMRPWGDAGVQLSAGSDFKASPKCAAATDGFTYYAWTNQAGFALQRVSAAGVLMLGTGIVVSDGEGATNSTSDLTASTDGDVIVSWVRAPSGFLGPKHIAAMKFDETGTAMWPGDFVSVFDGDSLQFGNFPEFVSDGAGGAVFGWYGTGPLQCYAQRINADGSERWAHNGVPAVTTGANIRVSPDVAFNEATGQTVLFWSELSANQAMSGISGQLYGADGSRLWSDAGQVVVPLSGSSRTFATSNVLDGDAVVAYSDRPIPSGGAGLKAARLDSMGMQVWATTVSAENGSKSRISSAVDSLGRVVYTWRDDRNSDGDIYAQNVNADGTLGGSALCAGDCDGSGTIDFNDLVSMLFEFGTAVPSAECDADGSGTVDFNDLVTALFVFGACD